MDQLSPSYYQVAFTILAEQIGRSRAIPSSKGHKPRIGELKTKNSYHQRNQVLKIKIAKKWASQKTSLKSRVIANMIG
jgi:hypothetical protein